MKRPVSPAPELPGYTLIRQLGGGGFADVFLYRQLTLDRDVAVKVLLVADPTPEAAARFKAEGTVMARLSEHHSNIVPVYDAAIASDGRPYLVMQYCPKPDLAKRYKTESFVVSEVLTIGVQLAGAVESAHQQGILHRDIKPANVLTTRSGRPALADFGIAVTTAAADDPEAVGVSIPWSPPELLADDPKGDRRSDVYSLTATLYTLLAGRSPLELPGRSNKQADLLSRVARVVPPPTGHPDAPPSLELLLSRGLAKDPDRRPPSAQALADELQRIQAEIGCPVTPLDLLAENLEVAVAALPDDRRDRTRLRPLVIRAQVAAVDDAAGTRSRPKVDPVDRGPAIQPPPAIERTQLRGKPSEAGYLDVPDAPAPTHQPATPVPDPAVPTRDVPEQAVSTRAVPEQAAPAAATPAEPDRRRSRRPLLVGAAVLALGAGLTWVVISGGTAPPPLPIEPTDSPSTQPLAVVEVVPPPADLAGQATPEGLVFTWSNPDPQPGDSFDWRRSDLTADEPVTRVTEPTVTIAGAQQGCIEVVLVRDNGGSSARPAEGCVGVEP